MREPIPSPDRSGAPVAVAMPTEALARPDPDPLGLIEAFLGAPAADAVERTYLAWLITLAPSHDPAQAAAQLLQRPGLAARTLAGDRLLTLLQDTTRWTRPAVATFTAGRRPHAE
jgi:hypothetical protein